MYIKATCCWEGSNRVASIPATMRRNTRIELPLEIESLQSALELVPLQPAHAGRILEQGGGVLCTRRPTRPCKRHVLCPKFSQK